MPKLFRISQTRQRVRKSAQISMVMALFLTGMQTTASAEEWLLAPYLRADLGYSHALDDKAEFLDPVQTDSVEISDHKGVRYQIGAGLALTDYLRTDITVSYGSRLTTADDYRDADGIANKPGNKLNSGALESSNWTTMMNVYVDPLSFAGVDLGAFSTYVQGGVGWARNKTERMIFVNDNSSYTSGDTHNDLAWQIGAGVGYAISDHWTLDMSYRFLDMGEARGGDKFTTSAGTEFGVEPARFDLRAHEFMVGLQYQF
ncbi:outer membrane protein [Thalassospira lucentensis]|uniref:outer membrane protein n=1 Tax=Thalassospira lucentensis TaxID=168935 RepID=UPI00142DDBFA|nr:outer membrane beta-barrel protein [Thalassospira lucentensis]NIZ00473.1 porin family protein [Thalassospira lucentensis]